MSDVLSQVSMNSFLMRDEFICRRTCKSVLVLFLKVHMGLMLFSSVGKCYYLVTFCSYSGLFKTLI